MLSMGGFFNGFVTAKLMRFFGAPDWRSAAAAGSFVLPCYLFIVFCIVDIIEWAEKSSSYMPFTSVILLALIWIIITVPIACAGSHIGF